MNKTLPENDKIRVIAIARGYDFTGDEEEDKRLQVMLDAVERLSLIHISFSTCSGLSRLVP